jgi:CRP/FNR family transcriptional regulator
MDSFTQFIQQYPTQTFKKGETILLKGDTPRATYVIESGFVKVYTITNSGDERVVAIGGDQEDFPVGYTVGLIERSQYFYEAFTKCQIRFIPRSDYLAYISSDIEIMQKRLVRLTILLLSTHSRIDALEQPRASDKIAHTLVYMANQFGVNLRPHKSHPYKSQLQLSVTQQEIANTLGLTRETTSIELKKLEVKQLISHSRKTYILYMERLRKYLDETDDFSHP